MTSDKLNFNPEALAEIIELESSGESGLVSSLIELYLVDCQELMQKIESSSADQDFKLLERSAHTLKSSSSLLGLEKVAGFAFTIEDQARDKKFDPFQIENLKRCLDEGLVELNKFHLSRNLHKK